MITEYLGRAIPREYLDFIDNSSLKEDFQSWYFNSPYYHNKKINLYTKQGLLSNSYDKKSYWYEWISKGDYDVSKIKPLRQDEPIGIDELKTCFVIADTYEGNVFINLYDASVWHFRDDSDWDSEMTLYHCEKLADSFGEFVQMLSLEPIGDKFEDKNFC